MVTKRHLLLLAAILLVPLAGVWAVFFGNYDTALVIANRSGGPLYVAVTSNGGGHWVARVPDGAEGIALEWMGGIERPVTVLDEACEILGTLKLQADGSYATEAAPGLSAYINDHARWPWEPQAPGVERTADCGGQFFS